MAERQAMIDAFLDLLAARGWRGFALRDVAEAAGVSLADLYAAFPSRLALFQGFIADVDRQVMAGATPSLDPEETVRDRLFDAMMRRFDALRARKEAMAAMAEAVPRDLLAVPAMARTLRRSMAVVLESAGVSAEGLQGAVRQKALAAMHLGVMRVWLGDDSPDQAKTMAALDHRLKRMERWAQTLDRFGKFAGKRRYAPAGEEAAGTAGAGAETPPA